MARTFRLRLYQDDKYPGVSEGWAADLRLLFPSNVVRVWSEGKDRGCHVIGVHNNLLPWLFPQHGAGPKHERALALTVGQRALVQPRALLRGLLHSDGCRYTETRPGNGKTYSYTQYAFTNRSEDLHALVAWAASELGLNPTRRNTKNTFFRRREDVSRLDEFVGPKF